VHAFRGSRRRLGGGLGGFRGLNRGCVRNRAPPASVRRLLLERPVQSQPRQDRHHHPPLGVTPVSFSPIFNPYIYMVRFNHVRRLFILAVFGWLLLAAIIPLRLLDSLHETSRDLPFGVFRFQGGAVCAQDFSYNLLFLRGIQQRLAPHPYRLEGQEKIARTVIPGAMSGLTHAYSPVTLPLALPLLALPGQRAYEIYLFICSAAILLLFGCDLVPRMESPRQLAAAAICVASACLLAMYNLGQTAILTTPLIGALWYLLRRPGPRGWMADATLAVLFAVCCFKPSVAIVPGLLLLAAGAGRALALAVLILAGVWVGVAPYYGGLWPGLIDYTHLLNHYNNADFTPFLRRDYLPGHDDSIRRWFACDRAALLGIGLGLLAARRLGPLSASEHFQATIWAFLLFSPYQLPSEDFILCLLIVEGRAFLSGPTAVFVTRLILLALILDWRVGITSPMPYPLEFPCKCLLAGSLLAGWLLERFGPWQPATVPGPGVVQHPPAQPVSERPEDYPHAGQQQE